MCAATKAAFMTLGCKVNQYETDAMEELLEKAGYEIVDFKDLADVYIVNTCSVTNVADRKSRQMLRRARKANPDAVIVAAGCYVQSAARELQSQGIIDVLIGNNKKKEIVRILSEYESRKTMDRVYGEVPDMASEKEYEDLGVHKTDGHTRAYVKIQDGCNQFCSYCIIPYTRGRIRSRKPEAVLEEIRRLSLAGYREIVLTGIHLSSYGKDLADTDLLDIIKQIEGIDGIERIRLGSLEPRIITEDFVRGLVDCPKVCPHFHLSLQSGCDETLKRMNRHYTTADYEQAVEILRQHYDRPALTTDVIAGFAGESEEEFAVTKAFLEKIRLYEMHIFKYSVRKGTRAERMEGHLPETVKAERSGILLELSQRLKHDYEASLIGSDVRVLIEEKLIIDGISYMVGHTERYVKIAVKFDEKDIIIKQNDIVVVKIEGFVNEKLLFGKILIEF